MPVEGIPYVPADVQVRRNRTASDSDKPEAKASATYLVRFPDKTWGPDAALAACPGIGSPYSDLSPGLVLASRDCREIDAPADGGALYEVTAEFTTKSADPGSGGGGGGSDPNPLTRPTIVKLSFDSFEETAYRFKDTVPAAVDGDGNPVTIAGAGAPGQTWFWRNAIVNSLGRPFDPSITDVYRDPVFTIIKNYAELPWDLRIEYDNATNSDAFSITYRGNTYSVGIGQAWLADSQSEPGYENGIAFETVTWTLKIRKDGWDRKVLDQGLEEWATEDITPSAKRRPILDAHGDPITTPALLDGKGKALPVGSPPVFLIFPMKNPKPFATLPF